MPKARIVDTHFWDDEDVACLNRDERLLLLAMITVCADDFGNLHANAAYLRKAAFGYDPDLTTDDVLAMRDRIVKACRNVVLYENEGREYIHLRKFTQYQRIRYQARSTIPKFSEDSQVPGEIAENSRNLQETAEDCGAAAAVNSTSTSTLLNSTSTLQEGGVGGDDDGPEPAVAHIFGLLDRAGVELKNFETRERYVDLALEINDLDWLTEAFEESARTNQPFTPAWIDRVWRRCQREGCRPGQWPKRSHPSRASPEPVGVAAVQAVRREMGLEDMTDG